MKQRLNPPSRNHATAVDPAEIDRFQAMAADWWDRDGAMAPLHVMNPVRLEWLVGQLKSKFNTLKNINLLDVGCGGGLVAEPLSRLGMRVTGIDGASDLIAVAKDHAKAEGLSITYRCALTDDLIAENKTFDAVIASEVIEHVPDPAAFVDSIARLLRPGGIALFSTLNRTPASFAVGIVAAEYVLRMLPAGTHQWTKFIKPSELHGYCTAAGLTPTDTCGMTYDAIRKDFKLAPRNLSVHYFLAAVKP